ncbi:MAG: murein biosynthesis integral membrane protein MurJ [Epsilonproteobacteria bacterium]|nr:murein biosynthesis integral membrane protein MurJ [Campylobacterota bacterium]
MFKSIFTNSFGILVSRILGFIRDMMQASILGANIYTDIFIVAFKLPNLFRRIFAEGAFTQSFLPSFTKSKQKSVFSISIFLKFLGFLLLFALIVALFSNLFTKIIASGFDADTISEAAPLVAINFYYLILIFIVTFLATLLQYKNHFATTAFSTALLNIAIITALILGKDQPPKTIVYYMSYAVIIGGFLQVIVHLIAAKQYHLFKLFVAGFKGLSTKSQKIKSDVKQFKGTFSASVLGSSTAQISAFLDGWLASFLFAGSISYLYYANRIFQFPLALFAIATSVAIFPKVARYLKNSDDHKAEEMLHKSFWFLAYLLTLATTVGIIFADEIVWLLYQRGAFTAIDSAHTSLILMMYLIGLLPFGISRIFSLWLYAKHQQKEAAKISAISLGINILLSLLFIYPFEAAGLALASSLSGFILFYLTVKKFGWEQFVTIVKDKKVFLLLLLLAITILISLLLKTFLAPYIIAP